MKKKFIETLLATAILATGFIASVEAKPEHEHAHGIVKVFKKLDLTREQRQQVRSIMRDAMPNDATRQSKLEHRRTDWLNLLQDGPLDQQARRELVKERVEERIEMGLKMAQAKHEIWLMLDAAQKQKLAELAFPDKDSNDKKHAKKLFKGLSLNNEQKAKISSLTAERKALAEEHHTVRMSFKEQEKALIRSESFNSESWLALANSFRDDFVKQGEAMLQLRDETFATLNEDQQVEFVNKVLSKQKNIEQNMRRVKKNLERRHQG